MDGFSTALNIFGVIETSINTASALYKYANDVKDAELDMKDLGEEINAHLSILGKAKDLLENQNGRLQVSQGLRSALDANSSKLASIKCQLDEKLSGNPGFRKQMLKRARWPFQSRRIKYDIENLRKGREDIRIALDIDKTNMIMDIQCAQSDEILSKLPVVQGAAFDAHANEHEPQCYPGTRVKILGEIGKWAQETDGRRIYWLCGMAGTGKSTICRTVSHHLTSLNIVTASFFFKKGDDNRDKSSALFTTIVKQLVEHLPKEMASHVKQALQDNPSISDKTLNMQFEKLILEPLESCKLLPPVIVVVLDALDECEDQASAAKIIELLPSVEAVSSTCFKVLVASRPECHLRKSFAQLECKYHKIFLYEALHEVADEDIRSDISIFLESQLGQIRDKYNLTNLQLPADWPPRSLIKDLVDISVPLFILAATACRYIGDEDLGLPVTLAHEFLQHHRQLGKRNPLARIYLPILEQLLVKRNGTVREDRSEVEKEKIIGEFRRVVGTIVALEAPLSIASLSELLQMSPMDVNLRLSGLNSVLNVPEDLNSPVKLFHLSFRDFLIGTGDQDQKHNFLVDERETHANLARQCITLLSRDDNLKQDICRLNHPGIARSNIDKGTIEASLPPHVRYACVHWVFHLKESQGRIRVDDETHRFLTKHLIHWLEALSLLGRVVESGEMVESLLAMIDNNDKVFGLLRDTKRFIRAYQHMMDVAPLQIYSSGLIFAPKRCEFRQCFEKAIPAWIKHQRTVSMDWDLCLQTLEGHNEPVFQAVLSPDSSLIASRSKTKVLIWRSHSGTCIHNIKAIRSKTIAFSPDSTSFYLVCSDGSVQRWETDTWTCKTRAEEDPVVVSPVTEVRRGHRYGAAISHDCKLVAVFAATGIEIRSISTPADSTKSIKTSVSSDQSLIFSPDSTYIVVQSFVSKLLEMWPIHGGKPTLIQHCSDIAFSPDSSLVALGFQVAVEICRIDKGSLKFYQKFRLDYGHCGFAFSHDAVLLAISLKSHKFGIWLTATGECLWTVTDHTDSITSLSFSHDSTFLVSSSYDRTLRIYSVSKERLPEMNEKKHKQVRSITISPDSSLLLLELYRRSSTWQVFRVDSGTCLAEFDQNKLQSEPTFMHDSALAVIKGGVAEIWHTDGRRSVQNLDGLGSDLSVVGQACFSADFTLAAGILEDRSLRIWRVNTGESIRVVKYAVPTEFHQITLCFSPDASRIAYASKLAKELFVWPIKSDTPTRKFDSGAVPCFALSNTKLAAVFGKGLFGKEALRIWSLETGDILHGLHGIDGYTQTLAFSYDSTLLASKALFMGKNEVYIWNTDTGARMQTIEFGSGITYLSFEPNGNSGLRTNLGRIKFKDSTALGEDAASVGQFQPWRYDKLGYNNGNDYSWITYNGEKILWLPVKYRGGWRASCDVSESVVAIASDSLGQEVVIEFDVEKIPVWYHDMHTYFVQQQKVSKSL
ncbi:uncharacterized protein TrAFT101_002192 [Trichoderma asperellum]|uniref:Nephrocystin 3-like N-terminal domain-containing protein n=1 Tax=Trichoderma asperellum (strain ATCC 204424 / CBS 433.97 / NBRC 101777) TaxID=1042311 RepID=A0A2T3ZFQ6_TRIA4|nr:hypothetical protein M441DRAFT_88369 [Trichoderma asperellum CBS 433.97]PTB43634.1 hypothetical protein M441DRAFT_88369 [Trichoderma asperellum CBS 433.97]UKZ86358.1 hypothetical protein TrAFT101_002192 [Trichoderma asperellum]